MKTRFYEEIIFCLEDYNNDKELMWKHISAQLQILIQNKYVAKISADSMEDTIIVIQFHYQDEEISSGECHWITHEEIEHIVMLREPCRSTENNS